MPDWCYTEANAQDLASSLRQPEVQDNTGLKVMGLHCTNNLETHHMQFCVSSVGLTGDLLSTEVPPLLSYIKRTLVNASNL